MNFPTSLSGAENSMESFHSQSIPNATMILGSDQKITETESERGFNTCSTQIISENIIVNHI